MPFFINELEQRGLRLPTVEEFASSLAPMRVLEDEIRFNHIGLVTEVGADLLVAIRTSDRHFRFMPGPEFSPRLYRGETAFHDPCVPSVFRDGIRPIDRYFAIGKWIELSALMDHHPATHDLKECRIGDLSFDLNIEAIAQHYGFRTRLMDFSRSKDVAMFFATCQYDPRADSYAPMRSGEAVLYTVDLKGLIDHRKGDASFLPLGLEPLPRPEAQRALAVRMNPDESLNDMPWISRQELEVTHELSQRYFDMFDGGAKLFPSNPFDEHVQNIRRSKLLPLEALAYGMDCGLIPPHPGGTDGARDALLAAGYSVELCPMKVAPETVNAALDEWEHKKSDYFSRIRVRGVADHISMN